MNRIIIREIHKDEITKVSDFIKEIFLDSIAPHYTDEGVNHFLEYIQPSQFHKRLEENCNTLLAEDSEKNLLGIAKVKDNNHLLMLFVKKEYQRQGVGKELLKAVIKECQSKNPEICKLTVNSSPNSTEAYKKMGFQVSGKQQEKNGIVFTPLELDLQE